MQLMRLHPRNRGEIRNSFLPSMMDEFFSPFGYDQEGPLANFMPTVDIYEKDNTVHVEAEVPGFNRDDLKVDVKGKIVTISGERKEEKDDGKNAFRKERRYGRFERSFRLDFETDSDKVVARYENGVLKVELPKPEDKKIKQIQIN